MYTYVLNSESSRIFATPAQSSNLRKEKVSNAQLLDTSSRDLHTDITAAASDEIDYEKALVDDITIPVGIRSAPSTAMLDNFMKRFN